MKRPLLISLLPLLLASCGGGQSSSIDGKTYFASLVAAAKAGLKNDAIGFLCDTGHIKASFSGTDGPTELEVRPLVGDIRIKGIHATSISGVQASILGKTKKHDESRLYASGPSIPESIKVLDGLPVAIHTYIADSTAYFDFSNSGVLRTAISNALIEKYPDYEGIMPRCHKKLDEYAEVEKYMPVDAKLEEYMTSLVQEFEKAYDATPNAFTFATENEVSKITFQATSWSTIRAILDREEIQVSSFDVSSFFDEAERKANIDRCVINVGFAAGGLKSIGIDIAFTFINVESSEGSLVPFGTWTLSGEVEISHGEDATPVTISESVKKQCLKNEFTLPF